MEHCYRLTLSTFVLCFIDLIMVLVVTETRWNLTHWLEWIRVLGSRIQEGLNLCLDKSKMFSIIITNWNEDEIWRILLRFKFIFSLLSTIFFISDYHSHFQMIQLLIFWMSRMILKCYYLELPLLRFWLNIAIKSL